MTKSTAVAQTAAALANVRDYYPTLSEQQRHALREWKELEELVALPFLPKEDAARQEIFFDVLRLGERTSKDLNDIAGTIEQWTLVVRVGVDCTLTQRGGTPIEFTRHQLALVSLPKGDGLRDKTALAISSILGKYGEMPGMKLRQLPPSQKGQSGAIVLTTDLEL